MEESERTKQTENKTNSALKTLNSSTLISETSEKLLLSIFIPSFSLFGVCIYVQNFLDLVRNQALK